MDKILNKEVSFNLAKLLKEKKFDKKVFRYFDIYYETPTDIYSLGSFENWNIQPNLISAPTIAEVIDWIYEGHKIWINVWSDTNLNLPEWKDSAKWFYVLNCDLGECFDIQTGKHKNLSNSPSEAYEAAIKHILENLIKHERNIK